VCRVVNRLTSRGVAEASRYERTHALSDAERTAWTGLTQTYAGCARRLDDELRREYGMTIKSVELLWQLVNAPGGRMRMVELADHLVFTRSGMTRLIERLERDGLVERCGAEEDARGINATITDRGADVVNRAADTAAVELRRIFFDKLGADDLRRLNEIWRRFDWPSNREREQSRRRSALRAVRAEADRDG
jgi:DNA-binding MarR family transcriptional regulator